MTFELSNITRLSSRNSIVDVDNETLNTMIIHPLVDEDISECSDSSSGHTHSLSPSNSVNHSNEYKHLEQQLIDKYKKEKSREHPPNIITYHYNMGYQYRNQCNVSYFAYNHDNGSIMALSCSSNNVTPVYNTTPSKSKTSVLDNLSDNSSISIHNGKYWDIAECHGDEYPLYEFAAKYFDISKHKKTSIFSSNNKISQKFLIELFSFAHFKKMKHSLLSMESNEMNKIGLKIWKNIHNYMGLRKSSKPHYFHIENILNIGLYSNDVIRDEIFCQIVKQTNITNCREYKKIDLNSVIRGWQLMSVCCSILSPSKEFAKYLATYLLEKTKHKIHNEMAIFSLNALDESIINGPRKMIPNIAEITRIEQCQPISISLYFLNDTFITLYIDSQTTAKQLKKICENTLKIKYHQSFSLYEMQKIAITKYTEYELKQYNARLDMNYHEKVKHLDIMPIHREIQENERIMDIVSSWSQTQSKINKNIRFVYKYKIFNKYKIHQQLYSTNGLKLIFMNEKHNVLHNKYPINSEHHLLYLAAIQLHCDNNVLSHDNIHKYIPNKLFNKYGYLQCEQLITQKLHSLPSITTPKQCWMQYIQYLYQSHDVYLFVGCSFYRCVSKMKHNDLIIGINDDSILIINPITKQIIDRYKLEEILTYGYKSNSFIFVAGTLLKQKKYQFTTKHGKEMNDILQQYIDIKSCNQ